MNGLSSLDRAQSGLSFRPVSCFLIPYVAQTFEQLCTYWKVLFNLLWFLYWGSLVRMHWQSPESCLPFVPVTDDADFSPRRCHFLPTSSPTKVDSSTVEMGMQGRNYFTLPLDQIMVSFSLGLVLFMTPFPS